MAAAEPEVRNNSHVDAQEGQIQKAAARAHDRQGLARVRRSSFGEYGLKAMDCGWITDRQIEAARIAMTRFIKRGGKVWIRLFPDKPITKKPAETRMGKGKGAPEQWVAVIRPGKIMFEMEGVPLEIASEAHAAGGAQDADSDQSGARGYAVGGDSDESRQSSGTGRQRAAQPGSRIPTSRFSV